MNKPTLFALILVYVSCTLYAQEPERPPCVNLDAANGAYDSWGTETADETGSWYFRVTLQEAYDGDYVPAVNLTLQSEDKREYVDAIFVKSDDGAVNFGYRHMIGDEVQSRDVIERDIRLNAPLYISIDKDAGGKITIGFLRHSVDVQTGISTALTEFGATGFNAEICP